MLGCDTALLHRALREDNAECGHKNEESSTSRRRAGGRIMVADERVVAAAVAPCDGSVSRLLSDWCTIIIMPIVRKEQQQQTTCCTGGQTRCASAAVAAAGSTLATAMRQRRTGTTFQILLLFVVRVTQILVMMTGRHVVSGFGTNVVASKAASRLTRDTAKIVPWTVSLSSDRRNRDSYSSSSFEDGNDNNYYDEEEDAGQYFNAAERTLNKKRTQTATKTSRPYWEVDDVEEEMWQDDDAAYTATTTAAQLQQQRLLEKDVLEWEKCPTASAGTAWVLLPPPSVETPTAVLHFVGGTLTGSAPHIWYRALLEGICRHTSCAIVATSIPLTFFPQSPLNHVRLATRQLQRQFETAYRDVLVDEYGSAALRSVPVCGVGHSLGARLLVVLATLVGGNDNNNNSETKNKRRSNARESPPPPPYKSFILISFTNYGAAAGIPGIAQLYRKSRMVEQQQRRQREEEPLKKRRDDDGSTRWEEEDDDDEDYDSDLSVLWQELLGTIKAGTARVQSALTPSSASLEFHPTPEQLWKALKDDGRYTVPQTLIVQFDDDDVDQSSLLATAIVGISDVKFCRLRGTHLTPVSVSDSSSDDDKWLQQVNSRAGRLLMKTLQGRRRQATTRTNAKALLELRQSIARYITEVVTKD